MKPTAELSQEHQDILRMIGILGNMADRLEAGEKVEPVHLEEAVDFVRGFADKCHHAKEEDLLFPAMEKAGIPRAGGPLGVMLREHVEGRALVAAMADSIAGVRKGDRDSALRFAENARGYGALLSQHIQKEDRVLYPMADARLSASAQNELAACFAEVERTVVGEGRHREFHAILDRLEELYLR
jgi:hemerythrin-like domain-containing protein